MFMETQNTKYKVPIFVGKNTKKIKRWTEFTATKCTQIKQGTPKRTLRTFRANAPTITQHTKHSPIIAPNTKHITAHGDDRFPRDRLEYLCTTVCRRLHAVGGLLEQEGDDMVALDSRMYLRRVGRAREQQEVL